jgi:tetratricopeptide (TPR) repeat protein
MKNSALNIYPLLIFACFLWSACGSGGAESRQAVRNPLDNPQIARLNDSISRFPKNAGLYFRRAEWLTMNNAHEAAAADYRKSWELAPLAETGLRYASSLSINNRRADMMALLEDGIRRFPENREFKRRWGEALADAGRIPEAQEWYDRALKQDPSDFETWYEKGLLDLKRKDTVQAIASLKKAYSIQPIGTYALELAHIYAESGNPACLELCDEVSSHDSARQWVDPFFIKGLYYSNTKKYEQALVQFDSCIRRDWTFTDAYVEKGIVFFKQKNYDEALHSFRMAATVSNTNADAYFWMGRCYEVINRKEEARINYERALALDKNFVEAREALKRLKS